MLSIAVIEPNKVEVVELPEPHPGPYQARIRTEAACVCNATDRKLVAGHFPGVDKYPLLLGHESVGIVDEVGKKVRSFRVGDRVVGGLLLSPTDKAYASGWGGFSEFTLAGDHAAMQADGVAREAEGWLEVYEIQRVAPADISVEAAVLLNTWREVYGGFGDFNLQAGHEVLIFGAGPVGLSFVKFGRLLKLGYIAVVDPLPEKRSLALRMGADAVLSPDEAELSGLMRQRGKPFDAVIDAVGSEDIVNMALPLVKMAGSVCVYGVIDKPTLRIDKKKGPYNFNLLVHQWPTRSREAAAQEPICQWLREGRLNARDFISAEVPVGQINQALELTAQGKSLKVILRF